MGTLRFVVQVALQIILTLALQRWDKRRFLTPAQRDRAWNTASWAAALYNFGPLSMLGWAWVTRAEPARWWRASPVLAVAKSVLVLLAGLAAAVTISVLVYQVDGVIGRLAGAPDLVEAPAPPRRR